MLLSFAESVRSTRLIVADWSANAVQSIASFVISAIFIVLAKSGDARDEWISLSSSWANAVGAMLLRKTFSALSTLILTARIQTFLVRAGLVVGTFIIVATFSCKFKKFIKYSVKLQFVRLTFVAHSLRVSAPSWWTVAEWSVIRDSTFSVFRARIAFSARVLTSLVDTGGVH